MAWYKIIEIKYETLKVSQTLTKPFSAVLNFKKGSAAEGSFLGYMGRTFKDS